MPARPAIGAPTRGRNLLAGLAGVLLATGCGSPTGFEPSRDLVITVESGTARLVGDSVSVEVTVRVRNLGTRGVEYLYPCWPKDVLRDSAVLFSVHSVPCIGWRPVIAPGKTWEAYPADLKGSLADWGGTVEGEYRLSLPFSLRDEHLVMHATTESFRIPGLNHSGVSASSGGSGA